MTPSKWVRITNSENIPLREGRVVKVGGIEVAVFNLGDRFLALENRCPHLGGPLADGIVSGTTVVCPLHAWKVDLESGGVVRPADTAQCVRAFQTRVDGGVVMLKLEDSKIQPSCGPTPHQRDLQRESATPNV